MNVVDETVSKAHRIDEAGTTVTAEAATPKSAAVKRNAYKRARVHVTWVRRFIGGSDQSRGTCQQSWRPFFYTTVSETVQFPFRLP